MRKKSLLLLLVATFSLLVPHASLQLSPVQIEAFPYRWQLAQWEVANLLSKWQHQVWQRLFSSSLSREERLRQVEDYLRLGGEERRLLDQRQRLAAEEGNPNGAQLKQVEEALQEVRLRRADLQPDVEEFLEGELSTILREQDILVEPGPFQLQFPPVDFRFDAPPRLLITSPRDRIERLDSSLLLQPTMTIGEMEGLEGRIFTSQNLSALVEGTGGIATYPAVIPRDHSLRTTLQTVAHEWLHHYLIFKPLGRRYWQDQTLLTLNETLANQAGEELGDLAYVRLGGTLPPPDPGDEQPREEETPDVFVFEREMRKTRLQVDQLLAEGKVEEAEAYMEERRLFFLEHDVYIRKLNQAYFAFHGSYGDSHASTSPVGNEIEDLRASYPSVGLFVRDMAEVSSYEEFQTLLQERLALRQGE